jgi:hypothetical protein
MRRIHRRVVTVVGLTQLLVVASLRLEPQSGQPLCAIDHGRSAYMRALADDLYATNTAPIPRGRLMPRLGIARARRAVLSDPSSSVRFVDGRQTGSAIELLRAAVDALICTQLASMPSLEVTALLSETQIRRLAAFDQRDRRRQRAGHRR